MKPRNNALELLRALFDLSDADLRADADLLARLTGHPTSHVHDLLGWLQRRGLVQRGGYGLTIAGLAVAAAMPQSEPVPMAPAEPRRANVRAA